MRTVRAAWRACRTRAQGGDEGFTLVEAVVALLVLALIFTALAAVSVSAIRASLFSRQNQQAGDLIGQRIEQLRPLSLDKLANVSADLTGDPRVQNCSGAPCVNIDGASGTSLENLVLDSAGAVTPHITTVQSSTTNNTSYTLATYVTVPSGQDPHYQRRVTVFATWTNTSGTHTRSDSTIISYGKRGLPLPYFKFVPMGPTSSTVNPGARIHFGFTLINQGAPDHWNITASDSAGHSWTFVFDDGSKTYSSASDTTALTDTTSDGIIDTGLVQPGTSVSFWAYRDVESDAPNSTSTLTVTATSVGQPTASTATASLTDTATVVSGVISSTPTATASTSAADCAMSSPEPTASAPVGDDLVQYTLHNLQPPGDTTAQVQLGMDTSAPSASTLFNYSTNVAGFTSGRTVLAGGSSTSTDPSNYVDWRYQFAAPRTLSGAATLSFWVSSNGQPGSMTATIYTLTKSGGSYVPTTIYTSAVSLTGSCAGYQQVVLAVPISALSLKNNDYIGVRLFVPAGAVALSFAYDTAGYDSNLVLPQE